MNTLHPIMAEALRPFFNPMAGSAPTPESIVQDELLRRAVMAERRAEGLQDELASLLRRPFEVEVETNPAVRSAGPLGCEAEYATVTIDDDLVREATDWLLDKHMRELEAKALELQRARWNSERQP